MNVSSLQLPNNRYIHIVYISIIASLLVGTALTPSLLRAAAQDDDARVLAVLCSSYGEGVDVNREGRSERISFAEWLHDFRPDLVDLFNEVGCGGISVIEVDTTADLGDLIPDIEPIFFEDMLFDRHRREGSFSGTFSGTVEAVELVLIDSGGRFSALIYDKCQPCTVDGKVGTLVFRVVGRGPVAEGQAEANWDIVASTGELANLCGRGTFQAFFNPDGSVDRIYQGQIKVVENFEEEICSGHIRAVDQLVPGLL